MNQILLALFLLVATCWVDASKYPLVCDGYRCDCDKSGEIDCDKQALISAAIEPVKNPDRVQVLSLRSNKLTQIKRQQIMLGKGAQVTRLYLSSNIINEIEDKAFDSIPLLEELDLSYNKLTVLTEATFAGIPRLQNLKLEHNLIEDLSNVSAFAVTPQLRFLSMDNTPIKSLGNDTFLGLENLIDLSIDHAELSWLPGETFKPLARLETLSLRHNRFVVIPIEELRWLPQLKRLDLSGNPIVTINSNAFRRNSHLHSIAFYNMPALSYIEDCAFCNVHELQSLEIVNCSKLVDIDPEAFGRDTMYFQSLTTIDLVNNSLSTLEIDVLPWENVTGTIRLAGNPWRCDCKLLWMANSVFKYDSLNPHVCASPLRLKGKPIPSLDQLDLGLCISARFSGRIRAARVFLIAAILIIIFGLITSSWYFFTNRQKNGFKLRNLFYKPQLPKYAYRNLAMGEEMDQDTSIVTSDGASILAKNNKKFDLASTLADDA